MPPHENPPLHARVDEARDGIRLDKALADLFDRFSRSYLAELVKGGLVTVDGSVVRRPAEPVLLGQELQVRLPVPPPPGKGVGVDRPPVVVVHEDEHLVVLEKPGGISMHPNRVGDSRPTIAGWLAAEYGPSLPTSGLPERAGIVHRLDRGTSGLVVAARTPVGLSGLQEQFAERSVRKGYRALVHGRPRFASDWIELPMCRDPKHPNRQRVARPGAAGAREARTFYELIEVVGAFSLLRVDLHTGRTHQIRVHLAATGHPLAGDDLYPGKRRGQPAWPAAAPPLARPWLHATELAFLHPVTGEALQFASEPPADLMDCVGYARKPDP